MYKKDTVSDMITKYLTSIKYLLILNTVSCSIVLAFTFVTLNDIFKSRLKQKVSQHLLLTCASMGRASWYNFDPK